MYDIKQRLDIYDAYKNETEKDLKSSMLINLVRVVPMAL